MSNEVTVRHSRRRKKRKERKRNTGGEGQEEGAEEENGWCQMKRIEDVKMLIRCTKKREEMALEIVIQPTICQFSARFLLTVTE